MAHGLRHRTPTPRFSYGAKWVPVRLFHVLLFSGENGRDLGRSLFGRHVRGIVDVVHKVSSNSRAASLLVTYAGRVLGNPEPAEGEVFSLGVERKRHQRHAGVIDGWNDGGNRAAAGKL